MVRPLSFTHHRHIGGMEIVMQNKNTNTTLAAAIDAFADMAFELMGRLDVDGMSPACQGARLLLQGDGIDFAALRQAMNDTLDALWKAAAPVVPEAAAQTPTTEAAAPVAVDAAMVAAMVREQVAAHIAALDVDAVARELIEEKIDNDLDIDAVARELIEEKIDNDLDIDDLAREIVEVKVNNEYDFDVDEAAGEIVKDKIEEDLDIEQIAEHVIRELIKNKPLTITLKG